MNAEIRPHRRQAAERLAAGEAIAAVDALGLRRREQHRNVVAAFGVAGRENLAPRRRFQQPSQRPIAGAPQVRSDARPVQVHVDRERRRRRVVAKAPLLAHDFGQRAARAAELRRHRQQQVARLAQLLEVLGEKPVLASYCGARAANRASISSVNSVALTPEPVADVAVVIAILQCRSRTGWARRRNDAHSSRRQTRAPELTPGATHRCDTLPRCGVGPHSHRRMNATVVLVCRPGTRCAVPRGIRRRRRQRRQRDRRSARPRASIRELEGAAHALGSSRSRRHLDHRRHEGCAACRAAQYGTRQYLTDQEFAARAKQRGTHAPSTTPEREPSATKRARASSATRRWSSIRRMAACPPTTAAARARPRQGGSFGVGPWNSILDFSLYDRCITRGAIGSFMPAVYGNGARIMQTPNAVVITYEMIHDTRVIPLDSKPRLGSTSNSGWAMRAATGRATRWWSSPPTSPTGRRSAARHSTSAAPHRAVHPHRSRR